MTTVATNKQKRVFIIAFKALSIFILILGSFIFSKKAAAVTVASQLTKTSEVSAAHDVTTYYIDLGTGLGGQVNFMTLNGQVDNPFSSIGGDFLCFTDPSYTISCGPQDGATGHGSFAEDVAFTGYPQTDFNLEWTPSGAGNFTLDTSKYYRFEVVGSFTASVGFRAHLYGDGSGNPYFILDTGFSTVTRIVDFTPEDNSTSSNPVTFSMHAYINAADLTGIDGVTFILHNIDENTLLSSWSKDDIFFLNNVDATTSGDFYFSTTTTVAEGNYRLNAILNPTTLWGWIKNPFSSVQKQDLSHLFIVGTPTFIGTLSQNGFRELQQFYATTSATSTIAAAGNCVPGFSFDVLKCGAFLFIPGGDYLNTTLQNLRDDTMARIPWGYFTRLVGIFNTTATSTLPTFTATIQTSASSTTSLTFDIGDMLAGGASLVDSIHDPIDNKTAKDVFDPMVKLGVALSVLLTIVADLTGSHRHHVDDGKKGKKLS